MRYETIMLKEANPFAQPEVLYSWQLRVSDVSSNLLDELSVHPDIYTVSQQVLEDVSLLTVHASVDGEGAALLAHINNVSALCSVDIKVVSVEPVIQQDWVAQTQADFPPNQIGRFMILGSHHEHITPCGAIAVRLDAGAAFGTGEHSTTSGCLQAIDALLKKRVFTDVLDMGCGTAILGMAVAKASYARVLAVDNDAVAVRVAAENIADNQLDSRMRALCSQGFLDRRIHEAAPYDMVIANILARPVRAMAGDVALTVAQGGYVVLSGFYKRDIPFVMSRYAAHGVVLERAIIVNGWATLILYKV